MPHVASKSDVADSNREYLLEAPEVSVFMACYGLRNALLALEKHLTHEQDNREHFFNEFRQHMAKFMETAEATHRFDVVLPVIEEFGRFSPFFWAWFNWWDDYLKMLPRGKLCNLEHAATNRLPWANDYRPVGDWLHYCNQPAFTITVV